MRLFKVLMKLGFDHYKARGLRSLIVATLGYLAKQKTQADSDYIRVGVSRAPFLVSEVSTKNTRNRVTVITDSVSEDSLFGGVATSLILGYLAAVKQNSNFRIITRRYFPDLAAVKGLLIQEGVFSSLHPIQGEQLELLREAVLEVDPTETIISTSWWTTSAVVSSHLSDQLVYLLQEDERVFYPGGENFVFAERVMRLPIRRIINTEILKEHLLHQGILSGDGSSIVRSFEPAIGRKPSHGSLPQTRRAQQINHPKTLVFYARPRHARNMFNLGLEAIEKAVANEVFDGDWSVHLIGSNIPKIDNIGGLKVRVSENLSWGDYQVALEGATIGLALQASPHPGYAVLDFATRSIPVITNSFGAKTSLHRYSKLIEVVEPDSDEIASAIERSIDSLGAKGSGVEDFDLPRTWHQALNGVLDFIVEPHDTQN